MANIFSNTSLARLIRPMVEQDRIPQNLEPWNILLDSLHEEFRDNYTHPLLHVSPWYSVHSRPRLEKATQRINAGSGTRASVAWASIRAVWKDRYEVIIIKNIIFEFYSLIIRQIRGPLLSLSPSKKIERETLIITWNQAIGCGAKCVSQRKFALNIEICHQYGKERKQPKPYFTARIDRIRIIDAKIVSTDNLHIWCWQEADSNNR